MGQAKESYPDQLRRMAVDLTQVQHLGELGYLANKLNKISDAIENQLNAVPASPQSRTDSGQSDP